jgi:hypothetical protein
VSTSESTAGPAASASRQPIVSDLRDREDVSTTSSDPTALLLRLIGGDPAATAEVLTAAATSNDPSVLVAAALLSHEPTYLTTAGEHAFTVRDRQLVVLAGAHLSSQADLFDALVRDHLAEHPDHLLAAWIAGQHH